MAASIVIEEERGTYVGTPRHPHNGYYAGDFRPFHAGDARPTRVASRWRSARPSAEPTLAKENRHD